MGYEALTEVLNREMQVCTALCQVSESLHGAVVSGDIPTVDKCVQDAQYLLMQINSLGRKREACVQGITREMGHEALTLNEAILKAPDADRSRLQKIVRDMQLTLKKHRAINAVNEKLLKARLSVIGELRNAVDKASGSIGGSLCLDKKG